MKRDGYLRIYWIPFLTKYVFSWLGKYISSCKCKDSAYFYRVLFETTQEQLT